MNTLNREKTISTLASNSTASAKDQMESICMSATCGDICPNPGPISGGNGKPKCPVCHKTVVRNHRAVSATCAICGVILNAVGSSQTSINIYNYPMISPGRVQSAY